MKRITLLSVLTVFAFSAFAGKNAQRTSFVHDTPGTPFHRVAQPHRTNTVNTFFSEDFSGGVPAGWQLVDNAGNGINWKLTTSGIYNAASYGTIGRLNTTGTTAANGYMVYDSDSASQSVGGEDADMITNVIDCSGHSIVHLTFNQFLYHFYETAKVFVSNDGTSWTEVLDASAGLNTNAYTSNADAIDLDITSLAANQATVWVKFNFTGDYDYWWMIDDVTMYEPVIAFDASLSGIVSPASNCSGLSNAETVTVNIDNIGNSDMNGFDISYVVDGGSPVTENSTTTVVAGGSTIYAFSIPANFSNPGSHTLMIYVTTFGDVDPSNDTISSFVYNGTRMIDANNDFSAGFEDSEDRTGWVIEDVNADNNTWSISDVLPRTGLNCASYTSASATQFANEWLFMPCVDLNDSTTYNLDYFYRVFNSATDAYLEVVLCSAPSSSALVAPIQLPLLASSISYLAGNNQFTCPSNGTFYIGFHVLSGNKIGSLRLDDINLSVYTNTTGVSAIEEQSLSVFPNPAHDQLTIQGGKGSNYLVTISNLMGQEVAQKSFANLSSERIDISGLAAGVYVIRVANDQYTTSRKIVVE